MNISMTKKGIIAVGILLFSFLLAAVPAGATTVTQCINDINALSSNTSKATFTNPEKDLTGLLRKLDNAITKLTQNKFGDAIQKLQDYIKDILALNSQNKIAPSADGIVTAPGLVIEANNAINCINNIGI